MKTFVDANGKTWELTINLGTVKRIEDKLGINILDDAQLYGSSENDQNNFCIKMATDIVFEMDFIIAACQSSIDRNGYSELGIVDLYGVLDGDAIEGARSALKEELSVFFQRVGKARVIEMIETWKKTMELTYQRALLAGELQVSASQKLIENIKSSLSEGTKGYEEETKLLEELIQPGTQSGDGLEY